MGDLECLEIVVTWLGENIDRPNAGGSIVIGKNQKALANRLCKAINDGAVYPNPELCTDVNGQTYVHAASTVRTRCLNADLKAIGY